MRTERRFIIPTMPSLTILCTIVAFTIITRDKPLNLKGRFLQLGDGLLLFNIEGIGVDECFSCF